MVLGFCFWIILFRFDVTFCINSSIFFSSTTTPSSFLIKVSDLDSSSTSKKNLFQSQLFNDLTSTTDFPRPPINNVLFTKNLTDAYVVVPTPTTTTMTPHDKSDVSMDLPSLEFQNYTSVFQYNYKNFSSAFDDRGMWILYEITNWFLAKIQPNEFPDCKRLFFVLDFSFLGKFLKHVLFCLCFRFAHRRRFNSSSKFYYIV